MSTVIRRLVPATLALLVAVAAVGTGPTTVVAADATPAAAETELLKLLNAERAKQGLVALRLDSRLTGIARARSTDMATKHYFSHSQPDGRNVFDILGGSGIKWYGAGEIIAWNNWPTLADSAVQAKNSWMGSTGHRNIVMSTGYNYVGLGVAVEEGTGKKLWTGVFIKGPDRTGGWVKYAPVADTASDLAASSPYRYVSVRWSGGDIKLVVLTAGFRHYQIQVRTDAGAWKSFSAGTTSTSRTIRLWKGHTYTVRVRACDKAGNCGSWVNQGLVG
jgi:uncharacterized protein YkwD